ncbi:MAG: hypothetical protein Q8M08_16165 [Bacteroidales bacterium]|nr:hypothetical protein [Bacteroidales bacterium]
MKKIYVAIFICVLFCLQGTFAQTIRPWPIPSFNIPVFGRALFQENIHLSTDNTDGRRRIHIQVSSQKTPDTLANPVTVWIYSIDHTTVIGPYSVIYGVTLTVDIDDREWGVMVEARETVVVSVWITLDDSTTLRKEVLEEGPSI